MLLRITVPQSRFKQRSHKHNKQRVSFTMGYLGQRTYKVVDIGKENAKHLKSHSHSRYTFFSRLPTTETTDWLLWHATALKVDMSKRTGLHTFNTLPYADASSKTTLPRMHRAFQRHPRYGETKRLFSCRWLWVDACELRYNCCYIGINAVARSVGHLSPPGSTARLRASFPTTFSVTLSPCYHLFPPG